MLMTRDSGGEEVLLDVGGQEATEAFEDVGHSDEAREILDGLLVGDLKRMVIPPFLRALAVPCYRTPNPIPILLHPQSLSSCSLVPSQPG